MKRHFNLRAIGCLVAIVASMTMTSCIMKEVEPVYEYLYENQTERSVIITFDKTTDEVITLEPSEVGSHIPPTTIGGGSLVGVGAIKLEFDDGKIVVYDDIWDISPTNLMNDSNYEVVPSREGIDRTYKIAITDAHYAEAKLPK